MPPKEKIIELVGEAWIDALYPIFCESFTLDIVKQVSAARKNFTPVYPASSDVFRVFRECSLKDIKVVIVGQDPYYTPGMADGIAFSVRNPPDMRIPPSLLNIFKELETDLGFKDPSPNPDLTRWVKQGVFLLNASLTVLKDTPGSHMKLWHPFIHEVLQIIATRFHPTIFVGWGNFAQGILQPHIDPFFHHYIQSAHPSPLSASRGFFGSRPFSRINEYLDSDGIEPIEWFEQKEPDLTPPWAVE